MNPRRIQECDKSRAICSNCGQVVVTTYVRREVTFGNGKGIAKNILLSVCDIYGQVVDIPAESTPVIREAQR